MSKILFFLSVVILLAGCAVGHRHASSKSKVNVQIKFTYPNSNMKALSQVSGSDLDKVLQITKDRANFISLTLKKVGNSNPDYVYEIPIKGGVCTDSIFIENGTYNCVIKDGGMLIDYGEIFHFFHERELSLNISSDTSLTWEMEQEFIVPGVIKFIGLDSLSGDLDNDILKEDIAFSCPSRPCILTGRTNLIMFFPVKKNFVFNFLGQKYSGYFDITTMKKGVVEVPVAKME